MAFIQAPHAGIEGGGPSEFVVLAAMQCSGSNDGSTQVRACLLTDFLAAAGVDPHGAPNWRAACEDALAPGEPIAPVSRPLAMAAAARAEPGLLAILRAARPKPGLVFECLGFYVSRSPGRGLALWVETSSTVRGGFDKADMVAMAMSNALGAALEAQGAPSLAIGHNSEGPDTDLTVQGLALDWAKAARESKEMLASAPSPSSSPKPRPSAL